MIHLKKLWKIGNSLVLTMPSRLVKNFGLHPGDTVALDIADSANSGDAVKLSEAEEEAVRRYLASSGIPLIRIQSEEDK